MVESERCQACGRPLGAERYRDDFCDEGCHSVRIEVVCTQPDGPSLRRYGNEYYLRAAVRDFGKA